jgi:hypothetical protein
LEDGLGLLTRLWCWAATYYPEGEFPSDATGAMEKCVAANLTVTYSRHQMGIESGGPPVTGSVTHALVTCGWLDELAHGERYRIHAWDEYQSAHADKAEREKEQSRERVRRFRNRKRTNVLALPCNVTETVTGNGETGEREREREKERERKKDPPCASQSEQNGPAGSSDNLLAFRTSLAAALGIPGPIKVAKREEAQRVAEFFEAQLASVPASALVADCVELARRSTTGTPSSLAWFKPWIECLPVPGATP